MSLTIPLLTCAGLESILERDRFEKSKIMTRLRVWWGPNYASATLFVWLPQASNLEATLDLVLVMVDPSVKLSMACLGSIRASLSTVQNRFRTTW